MLRIVTVTAAVALLTCALLPLHAAALALRHPLRGRIPQLYHQAVCRLLGVRVAVEGRPPAGGPLLLVGNHGSWLDIPVLSALAPVSFIAKREVSRWPLIGWLARLPRCLFIDRERRRATARTSRAMAQRLAQGDILVLFAEGTSSDGNRVLPFRSSLLAAVRSEAGPPIAIQPFAIAYMGLHGVPAGRVHRPRLAWYGAMDLLPHLGAAIRAGAIDLRVTFGEVVLPEPSVSRKQLARELEQRVRAMAIRSLRGP